MTRRDELASIAYAEQARASLASGLVLPAWDRLDPGQRECYAAMAEAVATAERERVLKLLRERLVIWLARPATGELTEAVPLSVLISVLKGGIYGPEDEL